MRTLRMALATALLPALLAAGCGGDDDDTLPRVDDNSNSPTTDGTADDDGAGGTEPSDDPTYAPKPEAAKLTKGEQSAYRAAVKDSKKWLKFARRLEAHPVVNDTTYYAVHRRTIEPYATEFFNHIRTLKKNGVRITGELELHWRVPVLAKVRGKRPRIVWKECAGDGSIKVVKHGEVVDQKDKTPFVTKVTLRPVRNGTWQTARTESVGTCGAD